MNILFIKHFFIEFMVSEIPRVSVFGYCPYSVTFPYCIQGIQYSQMFCNDISDRFSLLHVRYSISVINI